MLQILFIGSLGIQSLVTLDGLRSSGQSVSLVAVAGSTVGLGCGSLTSQSRYIPVIDEKAQDSILSVAAEQGIPVELLDPNDSGERLQPFALDVGIVSCYPYRLQDDLLQQPRFGYYNLHPSVLPKYRGPAPLFWQFRQGESETGVTLHRMDQRIDAGDIVAQERLLMSDGISERELSRLCATRGTALIQSALQQLEPAVSSSVTRSRSPGEPMVLNAFVERWVISVKDECLSKLILFSETLFNFEISKKLFGVHINDDDALELYDMILEEALNYTYDLPKEHLS